MLAKTTKQYESFNENSKAKKDKNIMKNIEKRNLYDKKFLKRLMMFGVVTAAAVTIFTQTDNASAAKKKTK